MNKILLTFLVLPLASCGALQQLSKASDDASKALTQNQQNAADFMGKAGALLNEFGQFAAQLRQLDLPKVLALLSQAPQILTELKDAQQQLKQAAPQAFAQADKNGDGKLSPSELLTYLLVGGGAAAGVLAKLLASLNAKAAAGDQAQQVQIDEHYDQLAELAKQLALLQQKQP